MRACDWFGLSVFALFFMLSVIGYFLERRAWNGGTCALNGLPWIHFDNDSQGGRGYKAGEVRIWISWPVDRSPAPSGEPSCEEGKS